MQSTQILATGSAFPEKRLSNHDLEKMVETSDEWIFERTGIRNRHIADPAKRETNSDFAALAATRALQSAGLKATDLDLILFATVTPDHVMPNTACILQQKIGAVKAAALDISAACSGFIYGLTISDALIKCGQYKHILLLGSEVLSSFVNWKDRGTCILFGDAAGAAILAPTSSQSTSKILSTHLYADGSLQDLLWVPAGGGSTVRLSHEVLDQNLQYVQMKGKEIYKVAVRMLCDVAVEALEKNGLTINDLDWMIPHQANLRIIEAVAKRLNFPMEKVILNLEEYGNTSSATVPTALDEAVRSGKIRRGDLVLSNVFGAGLTYGSALFRW